MSKVMVSPSTRVACGSRIFTLALTRAMRPGPCASGPISNWSPAMAPKAAATRSSVTATSKNSRPHCS